MASDWYFQSSQTRAFVESLSPDFREVWDWVMGDLLLDPTPDEVRKVSLPAPPFEEGLCGTWSGMFWLVYRITNPEVVEIVFAGWSPDSTL